jgi:hypothetical protein
MDRHPTTASWKLPPDDRAELPAPLRRTNLRALEARPGRFEHHLMVVAQLGIAQLEIATASEPLYFAHGNISDEYALPMTTGDTMGDSFPFRTFFADRETNADLGRIKHGVNQLVLHPHGILHWPGKLRPPYATFEFAPGMRRCGYSLVYCATTPVAPSPERPVFVSAGNESNAKAYTDVPVPFVLADLLAETGRVVGVVGDTRLELVVDPDSIAPAKGGYAVIVEASGDCAPGDLVYIPEGAALAGNDIARALVMCSDTVSPEPPPSTWDETPTAPFAVFEDGAAAALPVDLGELVVSEVDADTVSIRVGDGAAVSVPRYWLAKFLFRLPLHGFAIGYLETYGGFYYDDGGGEFRLGVRGGGAATFDRDAIGSAVEHLYRAVAPAGYTERLE